MKRRRDKLTPDLFRDFAPPPVVDRYSVDRVRAARLSARIKRAIAETIKDSGRSRDVLAALMSDQLGESISPTMLDRYTSIAYEDHNIPAHRLIALLLVTGDTRLINALLADTDLIAVDAKYEALIYREMAKEKRDQLEREIAAADAKWRAGR